MKKPTRIGATFKYPPYSAINIQHTMDESLTHISHLLIHMLHKKERRPLLVELKEAAFINVFPLKGAKERGHLFFCPTPH